MKQLKAYKFRLYPSKDQEKKVKDLKIRKWECPNCTNNNDRDINASINIMFEGIKIYMKKANELQVS